MSELTDLLERLRTINATVADLCREAGIARSTFDRWLSGRTGPNFATWAKVQSACARLEQDAKKASKLDAEKSDAA